MKVLLIAVVGVVFLAICAWMFAIPEDILIGQLDNTLKGSDMSLEIDGFGKGPFFSFSVRNITLKKQGNPLLSIDDIHGRVNPFSLFLLSLPLKIEGNVGGGKIESVVDLLKGGNDLAITFGNAKLEQIEVFSHFGLKGAGEVSGKFDWKKGAGDLKFAIKEMRLENSSLGGIPLPLDIFTTARGAISIIAGKAKIVSLVMEEKGIYARLKGEMGQGGTDATLEVMVEPSFVDKDNILPLISLFKVSPGYYVIPLKGSFTPKDNTPPAGQG